MTPFILKQTTPTEGGFRATMATDMESAIYKAHFPGNPVTPGACLVQAACDLMERHCGCKLHLSEIKSVKFLSIIIPDDKDDIVFDIQCETPTNTPSENRNPTIPCKAIVSKSGTLCAKMSLLFN